ncbi:MAG TPA: O-antigen ligase family protein [Solirubrobacterales bacterium]
MLDAARAIGPQAMRSSYLAVAIAAGLALLVGAIAVRSPQAAMTLALLLLLPAIRAQSRSAGLMTLWAYWLLIPMVRRMLDLSAATPGADPLSLLPFLGTGVLAVMELRENRLDRRARWILASASAGFLIGVPMGLVADPAAVSFAAVAYLASVSAFVLGWGDAMRPQAGSSLYRALAVALIPLSLYAIAQYFFPLTSWDALWVENGELGSIGAPQEDKIRVFSTLNSPFTFAIVLAAGIMLGLGIARRLGSAILLTLPLLLALALTYVRSAWLALVIGVLVFAFAARGRAAGRIVALVAVGLIGLVVVGGSNPTTQAFTERVTSLGSPEEDVSARERLETTKRLLPASVRQPLGEGLGQAGLAVRLEESSEEEQLVDVDDGYLSLLYQSGPFGLLLVLGAIFSSVAAAVRVLGRADLEQRLVPAALLATLTMLLVALASADVFFGLPGAIFWYLCGLAVAYSSSAGESLPVRFAAPEE